MAEQRTVPGMQTALTIAGSDSGGGAGVQADLKTWSAMNIYGCSVITAITAQNTRTVAAVDHVDPEMVEAQIDAVAGDIDCDAVKIGMVGSLEIVEVIRSAIKRHSLAPLVIDPVMMAKSGGRLVGDDVASAVAMRLFQHAAIVTPNRAEAAILAGGKSCDSIPEGMAAAREIAKRYKCHAVVVKGFERPGPETDSPPEMVDVFWNGQESVELTAAKRLTEHTHGAGCTFSAAITGGLASGLALNEAVQQAKQIVSEAVRQHVDVGQGTRPVNHLAWLKVKK